MIAFLLIKDIQKKGNHKWLFIFSNLILQTTNANKELSANELINHVWDENETADQEDLWINICYLRQKLQAIQSQVTISGEKTGPFMIAC